MKECWFLDLSEAHSRLYRRRFFATKDLFCSIIPSYPRLSLHHSRCLRIFRTSAPISSNSREEADFANLESHLFEKKHWNSGQVADEDHIDRATVSGNEYVEWVSSSFFQAQTLVPCGFEFEPPEPLEVGPPGPSSIRVINHRLDMPPATNIPPIQESRL